MDFRHSITVQFPKSSVFRQVLSQNVSEIQTFLFGLKEIFVKCLSVSFRFQTAYVSETQTHKSSVFGQVQISDIYCNLRWDFKSIKNHFKVICANDNKKKDCIPVDLPTW